MSVNKVLVLAVHPDDETLGCGGSILKHLKNGDKVYWLIATSISESTGFIKSTVEDRFNEINEVSLAYGFTAVYNLDLPTTKVDEYSMSTLVNKIAEIIKLVEPNIIYLPFYNDVHSDHRKIFEAAYSCTKSFRYPFIKKIYMMETLSETEFAPSLSGMNFIPNTFVDITEQLEKKLQIMRIYKSEVMKFPLPRSIENITSLANLRGATAGVAAAESFMLLKEIS